MARAFICDYIRTPIGRYGGALSSVRPDDLAAHVIRALTTRQDLDWATTDEVIFGCANQSGEDSRNVARMATLLSGLPDTVPALTLNRLCGSGMDAVTAAARAIRSDEADLIIAGGVESMSRAPFVMPKSTTPFARNPKVFDTTIGWRFVNAAIEAQYGIESMPETAENVATERAVPRTDQDAFALASQQKARAAQSSGRLAREITPVVIPQRKGPPIEVDQDEHPRDTTLEKLAALPAPFREGGTVTAGNAAGINDGAAALLVASEAAIHRHNLTPLAEILGSASAGLAPRIMGLGPVPAVQRLCARLDLTPTDFDVIELNEAFAAQCLPVLHDLGTDPTDPRVNPNGGGIALGHPLGMTGARIAGTAALELSLTGGTLALATMCVGVGQGVALALRAP
ncbi:3-oxoadipyl-CoA thiolase [Cognatishimia sp. MH4019]|uniref:3-oxoadipyl-CoA thiolase n=1 Tax=Cognatishimia sp. MH4019 TaxID=2854030 RepID=UPI001CD6CC1C|nr:3-oxoadipyl-CoA thiolase [Cognatishimia sp. MH4019]